MGRYTKAGNPLANEGVPAGLCLDIGEDHPAGPVDDGEQVPKFLLGGWKMSHDVHLDVGEPLLGHRDQLHGGGGLAGHFGPGAGLAVLNPICHVLAHKGPHLSLLHHPPGGSCPRVRHPVEGVEYLAAAAHGNHWVWVVSANVAQHPDSVKGDELGGEAGVPGCLDGGAVGLGP